LQQLSLQNFFLGSNLPFSVFPICIAIQYLQRAVIPVPVPKKIILKSELPVVPFSFVHKNPNQKDQHCITLHLDHDFDIRRQRLSDVVISED